MEASREAFLQQEAIRQLLGQVALADGFCDQAFNLEETDNYLYLPAGVGERRLVIFHATENGPGDMQLESAEERHAKGWRKCAAGAGFYGGNTPYAASASLVDSENPRQIHLYATDPVRCADIRVPRGAGYLGKMIRAQFDERFAERHVRQRTAEAAPIELLEPGLVSAALRDVHVKMNDAGSLKPRWIKVSASSEDDESQMLQYLGTLKSQPEIHKSWGQRVRFWTTVSMRIGDRALSGATSRG
ncbi:MAG TPA: hypothetical protein VJ843_05795 [Candidatus Saccharimonadales bacterium]|nr:hypothetical protein [Candidatus Saccharimonadales bacterium]